MVVVVVVLVLLVVVAAAAVVVVVVVLAAAAAVVAAMAAQCWCFRFRSVLGVGLTYRQLEHRGHDIPIQLSAVVTVCELWPDPLKERDDHVSCGIDLLYRV